MFPLLVYERRMQPQSESGSSQHCSVFWHKNTTIALLFTSSNHARLLNGLAALNLISRKCFVNFQFCTNPESCLPSFPRSLPLYYPRPIHRWKDKDTVYIDMQAALFKAASEMMPSLASSSSPETEHNSA